MKMLLFLFNGLFFLGGAAMMGIGIWFIADPSISEKFDNIAVGADNLFKAAAITMIAVGVLILIIGFFGCCGAIRESQCMLCTFVVMIVIIFILEIVVAVLAAVFKDEIASGLQVEMEKQVINDVEPVKPVQADNSATSLAWHSLQADLQCCGANNYNDYRNNTNFNSNPNHPLPKTCCMLQNKENYMDPQPVDWDACKSEFNNNVGPENAMQLHTNGCYVGLENWFVSKAGILIGVACGIFVIQLLGIVFACCLRNEIKRPKEYV